MVHESVNVDDVIPDPIWNLQLKLGIALGNEPEEGYYYNASMRSVPDNVINADSQKRFAPIFRRF
ncbi:hypothetical protein [Nitrosomonas supralitoralis]|uniref:Uncharacterized protein n=1 Tax=Nitrosomonas supralitoralis TaxID=2116706 RepID=A0A2P7NT13_9PROT|nr:hypothetical protein [Nitrosomonas supralitoralis]PSJ16611.1 hypothetical protein C7H79_12470 [Nitrosomonas supralitoralis]